jgi:hypothetical protein
LALLLYTESFSANFISDFYWLNTTPTLHKPHSQRYEVSQKLLIEQTVTFNCNVYVGILTKYKENYVCVSVLCNICVANKLCGKSALLICCTSNGFVSVVTELQCQ